jgi:hypothetical protein
MNPQRRFAPNGGLFEPESVAGLARIRISKAIEIRRNQEARGSLASTRLIWQSYRVANAKCLG